MSARQQQMLLAGGSQYQISKSLRFRASNSAYLSKTFGVPTSQNTWTLSWWGKKSALSIAQQTFNANGAGASRAEIGFTSGDVFYHSDASTTFISTAGVYRDPSAWEHYVLRSNGSGSLQQLYKNGVLVTATSSNLTTSQWNVSGVVHYIGCRGGSAQFYDGYLAEIIFIDGQSLAPTSFGTTEVSTNTWNPIAYAGTYGANGFRLDFSDNSSTANLGTDRSGNSNTWTVNNVSVTAGVTNDSFTDSPTNYGADTGVGGEVRGNYSTLNSVASAGALSSGNLAHVSIVNNVGSISTIAILPGDKTYFEFKPSAIGAAHEIHVGVQVSGASLTASRGGSVTSYSYMTDGTKSNGVASSIAYGASWTTANLIGCAVDRSANTITFYKDNASQGSFSIPTTGDLFPWIGTGGGTLSTGGDFNFGQRAFSFTAPAGFKALCTQNFPALTITKPTLYFDANLRTGTGATFNVTGKSLQPDFVWVKGRSGATDNIVYDSTRTATKQLITNTTAAETTEATGLTAFNTDGFTGGALAALNTNTATYVDWIWKKGATSGFDIVTFTKANSTNETFAHSLGVAPKLMIMKERNVVDSWYVWHTSFSGLEYIQLNTTAAKASSAAAWNSTVPSSSVFSMGTTWPSSTWVNYLWAEVPGFSKFGTYTGNASTDGTFVYCGFRPRWIMLKETSTTGNWQIIDTARDPYNAAISAVQANLANAESSPYTTDILSNGFKFRTTASPNASATYIFAAFAEAPFTYARAR